MTRAITAKTQVLALFGDPVGQSLSPVMHNGWFEDHGIDAVYLALPLRSADPVAAFKAMKGLGLKGANVTVPHKEAAAAAADRTQAPVANVLRWESDGSVSAFNTDSVGLLGSLDESAPGWRERVKSALIIGAGGGAYGAAAALAKQTKLIVANRTYSRAAALVERFPGAAAAAWEALPACFADADLIVQCTTLGMGTNASPDWPLAHCRKGTIVLDIVYRPLETPFLKTARAHGLIAVDGLGMLIHQGAAAFEHWFGITPDPASARRRMLAALGETAR